jgi:divalent metal cation (Fe/Co/Zn/Cd) transporter
MDRLAFGGSGCVHRAELSLSLCSPSLRPEPSWVGLLLLATAAVIMPGLGRAKRHLATELDSASLRADAAQSSAGAYLSGDCLGGPFVQRLGSGGLGPILSPRSGFCPSSSSRRARHSKAAFAVVCWSTAA